MLIDLPWKTALLVVPLLVAGCAPAYHAYTNGCVSYGYCPPPPLPHICYPPPTHCAEANCPEPAENLPATAKNQPLRGIQTLE